MERFGPVNQVNHTSWEAVVTPTDRPKSVRNRCVIEHFCGVVCVVTLPFWHYCWCEDFCHRTESDLFLFLLKQSQSASKCEWFFFCHLKQFICWVCYQIWFDNNPNTVQIRTSQWTNAKSRILGFIASRCYTLLRVYGIPCKHEFPVYPSGQSQTFGLTHLPPCAHPGLQIAKTKAVEIWKDGITR